MAPRSGYGGAEGLCAGARRAIRAQIRRLWWTNGRLKTGAVAVANGLVREVFKDRLGFW